MLNRLGCGARRLLLAAVLVTTTGCVAAGGGRRAPDAADAGIGAHGFSAFAAESDRRLAAAGDAVLPRRDAPSPPGGAGSEAARATDARASGAASHGAVGAASSRSHARLAEGDARLGLPAGRSIVVVALPAARLVSIGVFGPQRALLGFDMAGPASVTNARAHGALDEDGLLPRIVSLRSPSEPTELSVLVDAAEPVEIARVAADPAAPAPTAKELRLGQVQARPMVGLPAPFDSLDGYLLQSPGRYQFLRVDVAQALAAALRQTRVRFRRDAIAVADVSQWDGIRPATDVGRPRHISHEGGRDVDIALPANDGDASTVRPHCSGVLVEADVQGCAPGTARGVDALRLAYLLGLLIEPASASPSGPARVPPPLRVERIYTDEVYVREIRRAAEQLRERRWIKDSSFEALLDEGFLRPSPWHTDHVHVRFVGEAGRPLW